MERLHADKHKVEDRLNTLEKSALYERTILEGGGGGPDEEDIGMLAYNDDLDNGVSHGNILTFTVFGESICQVISSNFYVKVTNTLWYMYIDYST